MRHRNAGPYHDPYGSMNVGYGPMGGVGSGYNNDGAVFKDKPRRRGSFVIPSFVTNRWMGLLSSVFFAALALNFRWQHQGLLKSLQVSSAKEGKDLIQKLLDEKKDLDRQFIKAKSAEKQAVIKVQSLEKQQRVLEQERDNLKKKASSGPDPSAFQAREQEFRSLLQRLQNATQKTSKDAVLRKFGSGPHRVEISVTLPNDPTGSILKFVVEMAPLELMPHTVHLFLEQVHAGLWNTAWFYVNGPHVMQCGPQAADRDDDKIDDRVMALRPFRDLELANLHFPEFSPLYPHERWTLGMTGRPGGPDWYINKQNNTIGHGPGGQSQYALGDLYADPCFAKVVEGFDVLERIYQQPTAQSGDYRFFFDEPVHIFRASIVSPILPQLQLGQVQQLQQQMQQTGQDGGQQQVQQQQQYVQPQEGAQQQQSQVQVDGQQQQPQQIVQQQQVGAEQQQQANGLPGTEQQSFQQQQVVAEQPLQPLTPDMDKQQQQQGGDQQQRIVQELNGERHQNANQGPENANIQQAAQASEPGEQQVPQQQQQQQEQQQQATSGDAGRRDGKRMKQLMMARRPPLTVEP